MKKLLYIVLILVVLGAVAPIGFGFWAQSRLNAMLDDLNQSGEMDFTTLKVSRGWLSSTAIISAELSGKSGKFIENYDNYLKRARGTSDGSAPASPKVIIRATVYHGPFAFLAGGAGMAPVVGLVKMDLREGVEEDAKPIIAVPYTLQARLELSGRNKILVNFPEYKGSIGKSNASVVWKGLKAKFSFSAGLEKPSVDIKAPSLSIEDAMGRFLLEGVDIVSKADKVIEGISIGKGYFKIGEIAFNNKRTQSAFKMQNMKMDAASDVDGGNINSTVKTTIKEIMGGGEKYGPATLNIAVRNLDAAAIGRINRQMKAMQKQKLPPKQAGMMMFSTVFAEVGNIMKKGPVIEVSELKIKTSYGDLTGSAMMTVDTSKPELLSNPFLLKNAIIANVKLQVPEDVLVAFQRIKLRAQLGAMARQYSDDKIDEEARSRVQQQMSALVAGNVFIKEGNIYKLEASYKDGTPVVNGHVFHIPVGGRRPRR